MISELLVLIGWSGVVNKVSVAVYTLFGIAGPGINDRSVSQHGPPIVRDIQKIAMALLALLILEGSIGLFTVFFMIVGLLGEMNEYVLHAMHGLGIEKVEGIVRGW
jgi:hypothetical protein